MLQHRDLDSEPRWPSKADTRPWRSRIILSSSFENHNSVLGYWIRFQLEASQALEALASGFGRAPGSRPSPSATLRHLHERHRRRGARKPAPQQQGVPLGTEMDRSSWRQVGAANAAGSTASVPTLKLET